jgi:hypothetical protein
MKEPTASALAAASGLTIVGGSILGLPTDALLAGFGGGLVALSFGASLSWGRKVSSVAVATIAAAYLAPALVYLFTPSTGAPELVALKALAFVIGAGAQAIIPAVINRVTKVVGGDSAERKE